MIGLVFRCHRRQIKTLALHIESERRLMQRAARQGHLELQQKLHSRWALAGCFACGVLVGGYGTRLSWRALTRWARRAAVQAAIKSVGQVSAAHLPK